MTRGPVDLLLNFLKEYHLQGRDENIRSMLQDICAGSRDPRELGHWGQLSPSDVGEAVAAFEVWKSEGRVSMPAFYSSNTFQHDIECFVIRRNTDGTLDLGSQFAEPNIKRRAGPTLVRPRPHRGWYVPWVGPEAHRQAGAGAEQMMAGGLGEARPASAEVVEVAGAVRGMQGGGVGAMPQQQTSYDAGGGRARQEVAPHHDALRPFAGEVYTVLYPFDGQKDFGQEYLVLNVGDEVQRICEEGGWAFGNVRRCSSEGTLPIVGPPSGWYPAAFAKLG